MNLADIYHHEVLQSRHDRSRRAFFWARIIGLALMLTIGATLRSEPELHNALARAGMDVIKMVAAQDKRPTQSTTIETSDSNLPKSHVKVNRIDRSPVPANQLGRTLAAQKLTN